MTYRKYIWLIAGFVLAGLAVISCKKIGQGFLSPNIYYIENPFSVIQGQTATSSALVTDGSTAPMHVKILKFKDSSGNNVDSLFLKPQSLVIYTDAISYADSTVDDLRAKLKDSLVTPFNVAEIGGRLQFTEGTVYVPIGSYNMDISVTNVRSSEVLQNICQINILPFQYAVFDRDPYSYLADTLTGARVYSDSDPTDLAPITTTSRDVNGAATITLKFLDSNGVSFNPANGEVIARPGLPNFQSWDPYYQAQLTDTSIIFQYPDHVPVFPAFSTLASGSTNYTCYYRIPAKFLSEPGQEGRMYFSVNFPEASGSYTITFQLRQFQKK